MRLSTPACLHSSQVDRYNSYICDTKAMSCFARFCKAVVKNNIAALKSNAQHRSDQTTSTSIEQPRNQCDTESKHVNRAVQARQTEAPVL